MCSEFLALENGLEAASLDYKDIRVSIIVNLKSAFGLARLVPT